MSALSFSSRGGTTEIIFLFAVMLISSCRAGEQTLPQDVVKGLSIVGTDHPITGGIRASALLESGLNRIAEDRFPEMNRIVGRVRSLLRLTGSSENDRETVLIGSARPDPGNDSLRFPIELSGVVVTPLSLEAIEDGFSQWPDVERADSSVSAVFFRLYADGKDAFLGVSDHAVVGTTGDRSRVEEMLRTAGQIESQDAIPAPELSSIMRSAAVNDLWVVIDPLQDFLSATFRSERNPAADLLARPLMRAAGAISIGLSVEPDGVTAYVYLRPIEQVRASDLEDLLKGALSAAGLAEGTPEVILTILNNTDTDVRGGLVRLTVRLSNDELNSLQELHLGRNDGREESGSR